MFIVHYSISQTYESSIQLKNNDLTHPTRTEHNRLQTLNEISYTRKLISVNLYHAINQPHRIGIWNYVNGKMTWFRCRYRLESIRLINNTSNLLVKMCAWNVNKQFAWTFFSAKFPFVWQNDYTDECYFHAGQLECFNDHLSPEGESITFNSNGNNCDIIRRANATIAQCTSHNDPSYWRKNIFSSVHQTSSQPSYDCHAVTK